MLKEISLVCFLVITLIACGKKDIVVHVAAIKPIHVNVSNSNILTSSDRACAKVLNSYVCARKGVVYFFYVTVHGASF